MCYEDPSDSNCAKELYRMQFDRNKNKFWKQMYADWCERCGSLYDLTLDHIKPLGAGGGNGLSNIQVLCERCHKKKDSRFNWSHFNRWNRTQKHMEKIPRDIIAPSEK